MCNLLLPLGIKGLSASSVFFSIDNFNHKSSENDFRTKNESKGF